MSAQPNRRGFRSPVGHRVGLALLLAVASTACDDAPDPGTDAIPADASDPRLDRALDDARPTDARPTDARPTDARPTDARPTDAQPTDTRPDDAEPPLDQDAPDARRPDDATAPDAHAGDLAPPDAGPLDRALPDAAPLDAGPPQVEICDNGRDDDANRLADCDDPGCAAHPPCLLAAPEADCADGADDDADGLSDCDDPGCAREPVCAPPPAFTEDDLRDRFVIDCTRCHPFLVDEFLGLTANRLTAGLRMVEPGRHRDSYLWHKLNGSHLAIGGRGDPMPIGRPRWSPADVARFGAWINSRPPRP